MSSTLRTEILELEKIIAEKKKQLFLSRLNTISDGKLNQNISQIDIQMESANNWQISYVHKTSQYNATDYFVQDDDVENTNEDDSDSSNTSVVRETKISFGKLKKYFVKGGIKLNVYRNTAGELRVANPKYEFELDLDEQRQLVERYADNIHMPEWLAIKVFLYLSDNKWGDEDFTAHLTIV